MTTTLRRPWVVAFVVAVIVHLALLGAGLTPWDSISKCLLAPLLIGWVLSVHGPRLLAAALFLCFLGDLFLELEGLFIVGMAAFALAHVCFIVLLVRRGALDALPERSWVVVGYVVAAVALVAWAWGGLPDDLLVPVPIYAALLVTTASVSAGLNRIAGAGGLLFLVSDGIIALGEAGRVDPDAALTGLAIMTLYSASILLLTAGILRHDAARR